MNPSAEQINIVLDYQLTRIKQLEKELSIATQEKNQAQRNADRERDYTRSAYEDLKKVHKELLQTKKALRILINSMETEKHNNSE